MAFENIFAKQQQTVREEAGEIWKINLFGITQLSRLLEDVGLLDVVASRMQRFYGGCLFSRHQLWTSQVRDRYIFVF